MIPGEIVESEIVRSGIVDPAARSYDPLSDGGSGPHARPSPQPSWPQPVGHYAPPMALPPLPEKSVGLAFLLTFFFGPLGMLYSTVSGALILLGITLVVSFCVGIVIALITLATFGLGAILAFLAPMVGIPIWITAMIWGCLAASSHNDRVRAQYARHAHAHAQYGAAFAHQSAQHAAAPRYDAPRH
ncbi:hypothetical protein ACT3SP_11665 [Brachybacterium sp. AOP43-C2-M15]|uniref:hypothetical protein n=1 Tax=Brachybacterium sp. AOP43-C2-M15 TaxID=3457661 RepID=UPI0040346F31